MARKWVLLVYRILLGYKEALWQKNGDKSCQSNFDTQASDDGSFSVTTVQ